jgi:ABC-type nitrate/sulfonate/bicarbonate transport system permease component
MPRKDSIVNETQDRENGFPLPRQIRYVPSILLLALGVFAWEVYVDLMAVPPYLVPAPSAIWRALGDQRWLLWNAAMPTLQIAVLGFVVSVGLGLVLALAIHQSRLLRLAVYPIVIASQTVPLIALAPALVVILGFGLTPKLLIVGLICFFPVTVNAVDGFRGVDPDLINLMKTLGAGRWRRFRDVEWPSALPSIFSGAKIAATFCVVGALWGELVGSSEGLVYLMNQQQNTFDTPGLFASMVVLVVMGVAMFLIVTALERALLPWRYRERGRGVHLRGGGTEQ